MAVVGSKYPVKPAWIDPSWLLWEEYVEGATDFSNDAANRPYEIHQHACDRLANNPNEFDRVDAIMSLRRAVSRRVQMLKDIYQLDELPIDPKPKGDLELLSHFGIVRPFMLRRLIDIRNIVEHQDTSPPPTDECLMFVDLVWYFLRSTDGLVREMVGDITFVPPGIDFYGSREYHPAVTLHFHQPFAESPEITAWFNLSNLTYESRADWVRVEPSDIKGYEEDEPPQVAIKGRMLGADKHMKLLYENYFRISHFR